MKKETSAWIIQMFSTYQCKSGGIIRRSVATVEKYASVDELVYEVQKRGYRLIRNGDQFLILCGEHSIVLIA